MQTSNFDLLTVPTATHKHNARHTRERKKYERKIHASLSVCRIKIQLYRMLGTM